MKKIKMISEITFRELLREKVLYNVLVFAVLFQLLAYLLSRLTFVQPARVILDFGSAGISLSLSFIGVFLGSTLLTKEYEKRTLHLILSRPVSRGTFILGKFFGILGLLALNLFLVSIVYLLMLWGLEAEITKTVFLALFFSFLQASVLTAFSMFFSSFTTSTLASVMSIGVYLIGVSVSDLIQLSQKSEDLFSKKLFWILARIFPDFETFSLGFTLTYQFQVKFKMWAMGFIYGLIWAGLLLFVTTYTMQMKEKDI